MTDARSPPLARRKSDMDLLIQVLQPDDRPIDILKICLAIWESSERNVAMYSDLLSEHLNDRRVFEEIEFYLPQLAHMVIHLGDESLELARGLERLTLSICQQSMHTALQLTFIFKAALEDYQPELPSGLPNPAANATLYNKCAVLLEHIERTVVFASSPIIVRDIAKNERIIDEVVSDGSPEDVSGKPSTFGALWFKRNQRKAFYRTKRWKTRYFKLENHTLYCYRDEKCTQLLRCISLLDSRLEVPKGAKHMYFMELHSTVSTAYFQLRANSSSEFTRWVELLDKYC